MAGWIPAIKGSGLWSHTSNRESAISPRYGGRHERRCAPGGGESARRAAPVRTAL